MSARNAGRGKQTDCIVERKDASGHGKNNRRARKPRWVSNKKGEDEMDPSHDLEDIKFTTGGEQAEPQSTGKKRKNKGRGRKKRMQHVEESVGEADSVASEEGEEGGGAVETTQPGQESTKKSGYNDLNYYFGKLKAIDRRIAATGIKVADSIAVIYEMSKSRLQNESDLQAATANNKADHLMGITKLTDEFNERKFGKIEEDTITRLAAAGNDKQKQDDIYKQIISKTNDRRRPNNLEPTVLSEQKFVLESNIAYNTSDTRWVDFTGERPVLGFRTNFRNVVIDSRDTEKVKIFNTDEKVTDSIRYISTIFPLSSLSGSANSKTMNDSIKAYLQPLSHNKGQIEEIIQHLNSMNELKSAIRWTRNQRSRPYKTSDFITYLCRASGVTTEFADTRTCIVRKIEIHKKMVVTRIKDETSTKGLMVMCEEIILQLREKNTDNTKNGKKYRNTETCLILTSRAQPVKDGRSKNEPDYIHFQGMGSFSLNLEHKPINYDGILDRKIDMVVSTAWLIDRMSDATSDKVEKNTAASNVFEKLTSTLSVIQAASKTRINRYIAREQLPPSAVINTEPLTPAIQIEILQNSFISFQRAHMILPKHSKCKLDNKKVQRSTALEFFTTPSFALIVLSITGGDKPFNYVFLKTYSIHGSAKTAMFISAIKPPGSDERAIDEISQSMERIPVTPRGKTSSQYTHHLPFDDDFLLGGRSTLPDELELELELL